MDQPTTKAKQARFPIDTPKPEFGQPVDVPRPRKRQTAGVASTPVDEDKVGDYRHADTTGADPAKSLIEATRREGVDLTGRQAVHAWIAAFNDCPREGRDRIIG